MAHSIMIPDDLWKMYSGSPMAMRHVLYMHAKLEDAGRPIIVTNNPEKIDFGTVITLSFGRNCSNCRSKMNEGDSALLRTNSNETKVYLCDVCADLFLEEVQGYRP